MVLASGIAVVDLIGSGFERLARPGELVFGSVRPTIGGHACNVSSDLVRLGFPRSRLSVVFPVGRDVFGTFLAGELRGQGVRVHPVVIPGVPTSLDLILVARGEDRRYHADPGANAAMTAPPVLDRLERTRPHVYYAGGVGLLGRFDTALPAVLRRARRLGALTFVDAVSPFGKSWDFLRRALPLTDVFHCNADEARSITGAGDPAAAALALRRLGAGTVLVTLGGRGAVAAAGQALLRLPAFKVRVVDPTGAGDAFSAGVILKVHRLLERGGRAADLSPDDWRDVLVYASACGAACVTGVGTTTAIGPGAVERLMARQGRAVAGSAKLSAAAG